MLVPRNWLCLRRLGLKTLSGEAVAYTLDFKTRTVSSADNSYPLSSIKKVLHIDKERVGLMLEEGPLLAFKERPLVPDVLVVRLLLKLGLPFSALCNVQARSLTNDIHRFVKNGCLDLQIAAHEARIEKDFVWAEVGFHRNTWSPVARGQFVIREGLIELYNSAGKPLLLNRVDSVALFCEDTRFRDEDDHPYENRSWTEYRFQFRTARGDTLTLLSGGRDPHERSAGAGLGARIVDALGLPKSRLLEMSLGRSRRAYSAMGLSRTSSSGR